MSTSYVTAEQAARTLGVSRATLYAYVSRGKLRSRSVSGSRRREYHREDIERLKRHKLARNSPLQGAANTLGFDGLPVLHSGLCLIDSGRFYYAGRDAIELSKTATLHEVAELLWQQACRPDRGTTGAAPFTPNIYEPSIAGGPTPSSSAQRAGAPLAVPPKRVRQAWTGLDFAARARCYLAWAEHDDPAALAHSPSRLLSVSRTLVERLAQVATNDFSPVVHVGETLGRAWKLPKRQHRHLESALVLCADHELNVSTFTARCIASAGASPYAAITGALCALTGTRHGGHTRSVERMLSETGSPRAIIHRALSIDGSLAGFGHPLYPEGDPRCARLLALCPSGAQQRRCLAFAHTATELTAQWPNLDFGLVALARCLGLPPQAPFILFALGRVVGWLGHVMEQNASPQLFRPRASYTGPRPHDSARDASATPF